MSAVAEAVGMSRPHLSAMRRPCEQRRRGRPPLPDAELVADIRRLIADLPTDGYRLFIRSGREAEGTLLPPAPEARLPAS